MPAMQTPLTLRERSWQMPEPPARRTLVAAVVTEMAAVLEPVVRDPFLDGDDDGPPRPRLTPPFQGVAPHAPTVRAAAHASA
jgi:hypothetical protein